MILPVSTINANQYSYKKYPYFRHDARNGESPSVQNIGSESTREKSPRVDWMILGQMLVLLVGLAFAAKGAGWNVRDFFSKEKMFKPLKDDPKIPDLNTCKSINKELRTLLERQVYINKSGKNVKSDLGESPQVTNRLLLYGSAGAGKSFFAKVYAKSLDAEYAEILFSDVNSKWVGETERNMKNTFGTIIKTAKKNPNKKYVVTLNEIDSLMASPTEMDNLTSHAVSLLRQRSIVLNYLEVIKDKTPNVIIVGTTNISPSSGKLDKAVMSRFQNLIEVPYPDENCLYEALKMNFDKLKNKEQFFSDNEQEIKNLTKQMYKRKFSFRNLENIVQEAKNMYIDDLIKNGSTEFKAEYLLKSEKNLKFTDGELEAVSSKKVKK